MFDGSACEATESLLAHSRGPDMLKGRRIVAVFLICLGAIGGSMSFWHGKPPHSCKRGQELYAFWFGSCVFGGMHFTFYVLALACDRFRMQGHQSNGVVQWLGVVFHNVLRSIALLGWCWTLYGVIAYARTVDMIPRTCFVFGSFGFHIGIALALMSSLILAPSMVWAFGEAPAWMEAAAVEMTSLARDLDLLEKGSEEDKLRVIRSANIREPPGFTRGMGSVVGNNCWISSLLQLLREAPASGLEHDEECAFVRELGVAAGVWPVSPEHIEAGPEAVGLVCQYVQRALPPTVIIFAGRHGDLRQDVCSVEGAPCVHMFNPLGRHFDPLWPER